MNFRPFDKYKLTAKTFEKKNPDTNSDSIKKQVVRMTIENFKEEYISERNFETHLHRS